MNKRIVICAGHNKKSKGAINKKYSLNEFDEAWKVCIPLSEILSVNGVDARLITGSLTEKVAKINAGGFALALDLHFNADADHLDPDDLNDARGEGCMVMYCPGNHLRSIQAATMATRMSDYIGNSNKGGREGWYVGGSNPGTIKDYFLRKTNCAAFIPEFGYIDNNGFAKEYLVSNRHQDLAEALASGIMAVLS